MPETHVQSIRIPTELRDRIDRLAKTLMITSAHVWVSRSNVLVSIIEEGLTVLEKEHPPVAGEPRRAGLARTRAEATVPPKKRRRAG
jgi:hypothetical protein